VPFALNEEQRTRVFENELLNEMSAFGPNRKKLSGKPQKEEI
jgi:hypothetical protein